MTQLEGKIPTDSQLVERAKLRSLSAFSELVQRHQRGLIRLSLRFVRDLSLAEDIVQDSLIKAFEKLHTFEGRSSFKSWIYQITVNTAKNKLRAERSGQVELRDMDFALPAEAESALIHGAVAGMLQKEIALLPFRQRTALILRVYEDLSFNEIAEIMDCPYDTAKANYRHALLKLKTAFEHQGDLRNWTPQQSTEWTLAEAEG